MGWIKKKFNSWIDSLNNGINDMRSGHSIGLTSRIKKLEQELIAKQAKLEARSLSGIIGEEFTPKQREHLKSGEEALREKNLDGAYLHYMAYLSLTQSKDCHEDNHILDVIYQINKLGTYDRNSAGMTLSPTGFMLMILEGKHLIGKQVIDENEMISLYKKIYDTICGPSSEFVFSKAALSEIPRNIGNCYISLKQYHTAKEYFADALTIDPTNAHLKEDYARVNSLMRINH